MRLVIGGYAQGKLDYVLQKYRVEMDMVWDGVILEKELPVKKTIVVDHFHNWIRSRILDGGCPEEEILSFLEQCPECIMISDEIGNGIVPADAFEREYRERTGRILVQLAAKAEEVERVICGIGQRIK